MKPVHGVGVVLVVLVVVVPCLLLSSPGIPTWLGRTIATSILIFSGTLFFFVASLFPKLKLISVGPKLRRPEFKDIRPQMERRLRFIVLALGVLAFLFVALPLMEDVIHLCVGQKPVQIIETPRSTSALFGTWFLAQFVVSPTKRSRTLFYSVSRVQAGNKYEFLILPRSGFIVDFHELPGK